MKKLVLFSLAFIVALSACVQNKDAEMPEVGNKKYYDITQITPEGSRTMSLVTEVSDINDSTVTFTYNYTFADGEIFTDTVTSKKDGEDSQIVSMKALFTPQLMMFNRDSIEYVEGTEKLVYKNHLEENTVMDPARLVLKAKDNGAEVMIELSVEERNVYAVEEVTTPAGTYKCIKSSENHVAKIGDQEFFSKVVYLHNVKNDGMVRQTIYNKAGEATLDAVLTKEE